MKKALITILLVFFYVLVNAQSDFRKGYIISLKGDTIQGSINQQNDIQNTHRCVFKNDQGTITNYKPGDIEGYRLEQGNFYVTRFVASGAQVKQIFAEYLVKGRKSLFYYRDHAGFHYLLSYKKDTLIEIPFERKITNVNGNDYLHESTSQFGFLKVYFQDCPSLSGDIAKITQPGFNEFIRLLEKYNRIMCGDGCYKVFYKESSVKVSVELEGGVKHLKGAFGTYRFLPQFGDLLYLRLPRANKGLAVKTGLLYYYFPGSDIYEKFSLFTIPLQFEYVFLDDHAVSPKFDAGFDYIFYHYADPNIPNYKELALAASAGVLIKVAKDLRIDLNVDSDIMALRFNTGLFNTYSLNAGLYYKF